MEMWFLIRLTRVAAYDAYLSGKLADYVYPESKVQEALANLPMPQE